MYAASGPFIIASSYESLDDCLHDGILEVVRHESVARELSLSVFHRDQVQFAAEKLHAKSFLLSRSSAKCKSPLLVQFVSMADLLTFRVPASHEQLGSVIFPAVDLEANEELSFTSVAYARFNLAANRFVDSGLYARRKLVGYELILLSTGIPSCSPLFGAISRHGT